MQMTNLVSKDVYKSYLEPSGVKKIILLSSKYAFKNENVIFFSSSTVQKYQKYFVNIHIYMLLNAFTKY